MPNRSFCLRYIYLRSGYHRNTRLPLRRFSLRYADLPLPVQAAARCLYNHTQDIRQLRRGHCRQQNNHKLNRRLCRTTDK